MIERVEPPDRAPEGPMLEAFLDYYRATMLVKAEGLTDEQARTASVDPSILTITGLFRHMAEVERIWFQRWFLGIDSPPLYPGPDADLHVGPDDTLADAIAVWQREVRQSRAVTASSRPDDVAVHAGTAPPWLGFRPSMRWILVHMIEEYARHAGHADLIRERIDGVTGD